VCGHRIRPERLRAGRRQLTEFDPVTPHPVIDLLPEQRGVADKGHHAARALSRGARRGQLGGPDLRTVDHPRASPPSLRGQQRLREGSGKERLHFSGIWAEKQLVEIIEVADHPYFVAGQFHPEFRSRPWDPHPLFAAFVRAALKHQAA